MEKLQKETLKKLSDIFEEKYSTDNKNLYKQFNIQNNKSLYIKKENKKNFDEIINDIWCPKNKELWLFSKEEVIYKLLSIIRDIKNNNLSDDKIDNLLKEKFDNIKAHKFSVVRPVHGCVKSENENLTLGPFEVMDKDSLSKFYIENGPKRTDIGKGGEEYSIDLFSTYNNAQLFVKIDITAKSNNRSISLADEYFELFDDILKFLLNKSMYTDIGILNFNDYNLQDAISFSKEIEYNSLTTNGARKPIIIKSEDLESSKIIWNMVTKSYNGEINGWEKHILYSIQWLGKGNSNISNTTAYIQYVFALEALFLYNSKSVMVTPSIANQIAEYSAFILGKNLDTRKQVYFKIKKIYNKRSAIVHGGSFSVSENDLSIVHNMVYELIYNILSRKELYEISSMDALNKWIEQMKFS